MHYRINRILTLVLYEVGLYYMLTKKKCANSSQGAAHHPFMTQDISKRLLLHGVLLAKMPAQHLHESSIKLSIVPLHVVLSEYRLI